MDSSLTLMEGVGGTLLRAEGHAITTESQLGDEERCSQDTSLECSTVGVRATQATGHQWCAIRPCAETPSPNSHRHCSQEPRVSGRAARRHLFIRINSACRAGHLTGARHNDMKERRRCRQRLAQFAPLQRTTPLEQLIRVHTLRTSPQRHTPARLECQVRNPPLLRYTPPPANWS